MIVIKPQPGEYAPYAQHYIDLPPSDGHIVSHLEAALKEYFPFIRSFSTDQLTQPHASGEWTIQEVLIHITDVERIFAYRMLRLARHDSTELVGFDQDAYVPASCANERSIASILEEYTAVRKATLTLIKSLKSEDLLRFGVGSGVKVSVRGLLYHLAGHEIHHMDSIRENYG